MVNYIALIHKDADSDYGVSFPDLPGCVTAERTLDAARAAAEEALALHLAGLAEDSEAPPQPSTLETVMADAQNRDAVAILVRAPERARRAVRVNVTFSEDDLRDIDRFASRAGMTRSSFLARAARRALDDKELDEPNLRAS